MYSTSYQTVTAGRVREDEALPFFGKNKVTVPGRGVTAFVALGGKKHPTLEKNWLQHTGGGKTGTVSDVIDSYVFNPNQVL